MEDVRYEMEVLVLTENDVTRDTLTCVSVDMAVVVRTANSVTVDTCGTVKLIVDISVSVKVEY